MSRPQLLHESPNHFRREAPPGEEARLRGPIRSIAGRRCEAALAHGGGALQFGFGKCECHFGRDGDAVLRKLGADAQVAEARLAGVDARLDESIARQEAVRLEPVEQRLDLLGRGGLAFAITVTVALNRVGAGMAQELSAQLEPALVALREQLQRARLDRPARLQTQKLRSNLSP